MHRLFLGDSYILRSYSVYKEQFCMIHSKRKKLIKQIKCILKMGFIYYITLKYLFQSMCWYSFCLRQQLHNPSQQYWSRDQPSGKSDSRWISPTLPGNSNRWQWVCLLESDRVFWSRYLFENMSQNYFVCDYIESNFCWCSICSCYLWLKKNKMKNSKVLLSNNNLPWL